MNSYGGAVSAGAGERYLPHVTTAERRRWQKHNAGIQQELATLKAALQTPEIEKQIKALEARRLPEPRIMALWDRGEPSGTLSLSPRQLPERRPASSARSARRSVRWPDNLRDHGRRGPGAKSTGRRLAFARWLTQPAHPLTARVMVNRIWHQPLRSRARSQSRQFRKDGRPADSPGTSRLAGP